MKRLAERIIELTGSSSRIDFVPYERAYGANFEDVRRRVPDVSALRELLGETPTGSLDDTLRDVIAAARASAPSKASA